MFVVRHFSVAVAKDGGVKDSRYPEYKMPSVQSNIIENLTQQYTADIRPGLSRIRAILKRLKNPEKTFITAAHVAGTNGKGSTSAMLASVLQEAGYKTGLYTSPHLVKFNERIRVNRRDISDSELSKLILKVKKTTANLVGARPKPTFFEFTTAVAFVYFSDKNVDFGVLETGMGGRLDATNVVKPLVSIITNIGLDHGEFLGKSLKSVAFEKAGIIKKNGVVITAEARPASLGVIKKAALKQGAVLYALGRDFKIHVKTACNGRATFDYCGIWERVNDVKLGLLGAHQVKNAACVLAAVEALKREGFKITAGAIRHGLKKTYWPGRFEVIKKKPLVILDSAHNIDGAKTLKEALKCLQPRRLFLVLGIMADKDVDGIVRELAPLAFEVIASAPDTPRAAVTAVIKKKCSPYARVVREASSVGAACALALCLAGKKDVVCVAGSIYTVGEAKKYFAKEN